MLEERKEGRQRERGIEPIQQGCKVQVQPAWEKAMGERQERLQIYSTHCEREAWLGSPVGLTACARSNKTSGLPLFWKALDSRTVGSSENRNEAPEWTKRANWNVCECWILRLLPQQATRSLTFNSEAGNRRIHLQRNGVISDTVGVWAYGWGGMNKPSCCTVTL